MESGPNGQNGSAGGESVGDRNIERLLSEAYAPERPDAAFARRVGERMLAAARGRVRRRPATRLWRGLAYAAAAAALVAAGFFAARVLRPFSPLDLGPHPRAARPRRGGPDRRDRVPAPAAPAAGLTARPRPEARPAPKLSRGAKLRTGPRQRRRVTLPNGAVAYVNAGTKLSVPGYREMTLTRGEVYLEVPPHRTPGAVGPTYVVQTPHRKVLAYGTRFAVRADDEGTRVLVTQGKVGVTGYGGLVHAGRQLRCGAEAEGGELAAIGRASHELEWTKDLLAAARGPLVPASDYAGGALVAVDPDGQEARLSLRTYHVDVHVEDGFSRTTIDQTYFNHMNRRLEGTFYFPLPPDASISRLAMYVNGKLMEGGMAERAHARHVFETIMYTRRDPALLEWVDGSTFKMRVFPLEARQEKRIVLSYTQRLEGLYGRLAYRFCGGHNMPQVGEWSFHARVVSAADSTWAMPTHEPEARTEGGDLLIDVRRKNVAPDDDVVLHVFEDESSGQRFERFSTAVHEGRRYLMLRYRPDLNVAAEGAARRRDWVFLFESSGDRDPLLARAQIDVVRSLLDRAGHDDSFHILAIGTHVRSWRASAAALTRDAVAEAAAYLDKVHLVGALDLAGGLAAAAEALREADDPVLVHVGSGVPVLGERKTDRLVKLIPRRARYVGVGVGKRYNRAFMKAAAAATGGYFTQINPDENVEWRGFDLLSTLNTPRLLGVKVASRPGQARWLTFGDSLADGEELCAVTRVPADAAPIEAVTVTGTLEGKPFSREVPVRDVAGKADYLPRFWAKLEIDRLLAADAKANRDKVVALSKAMYVMSPFTSLLVLENEAMYRQYKVDRGRKDHWAPYPAPAAIEVVREPLPGDARRRTGPATRAAGAQKPSPQQVLGTILVRVPPRLLQWPNEPSPYGGQVITAWQLLASAHAVPIQRLRTDTEYMLKGGTDFRDGGWVYDVNGDLGFGMHDRYRPYGGLSILSDIPIINRHFTNRAPVRDGETLWLDGRRRMATPDDFSSSVLEEVTGRLADELRFFDADKERLPRLDNSGGSGWIRHWKWTVPWGQATPEGFRRRRGGLARPSFDLYLSADIGALFLRPPGPALHPVQAGGSSGLFSLEQASQARELPHRSWEEYRAAVTSARLNGRLRQRHVLYQRPYFSGDRRVFTDLLAYAPGMNTTWADMQAVLDAEAAPPKRRAGRLDPAAEALIERARRFGWRSVTVPAAGDAEALTIVYDGAGRYAYRRRTTEGLSERVICDGKTLWHLYEELGVGARRRMSRFHHAGFTALVPWALPAAADLARDMDVLAGGKHTVALSPIGAGRAADEKGKPRPYARVELIFASDGRLAERRLVEMPAKKVLLRQTYGNDGTVAWLDAEGKTAASVKLVVGSAAAPDLAPDTSKLVILPMPIRSRDHLMRQRNLALGGRYDRLGAADALAVVNADLQSNSWEAFRIIGQRFLAKGDRRIGLYTLLTANNYNWDPATPCDCGNGVKVRIDPRKDHPVLPLAKYVAEQLQFNRTGKAELLTAGDGEGLVGRLGRFRHLYHHWNSGRANRGSANERKAERRRALAFIRRAAPSPFAWAMLVTVQNYGGDREFYRELADAARRFEDAPGLGYAARYQTASLLANGADFAGAREQFRKLYEEALDAGVLPPIDSSFRSAMHAGEGGAERWTTLMRQTASRLIEKKAPSAVVILAWQCHRVGDPAMSEELLATALAAGEKRRAAVRLTAVEFLCRVGQVARADGVLEPLLDDDDLAGYASLWRLASLVAERRGRWASALRRLERAVEIEFEDLPEVVNLRAVRSEYGRLLGRYGQLAQAVATLETRAPAELIGRVVAAADRWRALDADDTAACQAAANVLQALGATELAWEYLTTPLAMRPNEAAPWVSLAEQLKQQGELALAERAYASAFEAERTNAKVLWDRAQVLQQLGRREEARELYRRIAEGKWPRQFNWIQSRARRFVGGS